MERAKTFNVGSRESIITFRGPEADHYISRFASRVHPVDPNTARSPCRLILSESIRRVALQNTATFTEAQSEHGVVGTMLAR